MKLNPSDPLRQQSMEAATKLLEGQKIALAVDAPFLMTCLAQLPMFRNRVCWAVTTEREGLQEAALPSQDLLVRTG